jgi:hypothetical protein
MITVNAQEDMKKSIQIINPRPDFALTIRLDKGAGATYAPGERVRVYFRTTEMLMLLFLAMIVRGR